MKCDGGCGLLLVPSEFSQGLLMHQCVTARDVLLALHCPLFGVAKADQDILETPSYWRSAAHFNHMWERSR